MKIAILFLTLASLWIEPAQAQLLHRYNFQTAGGANDTVGTANGLLHGTAVITNGALMTDGTLGGLSGGVPQNGVSLPAAAVAGITNAFSVEIWFAANYNGGYCTLFSFSSNSTASHLLATPARGVSPFQSDVAASGGGGTTSEQLANQIYCDNATLHDLIATFDGTNVTYYLDGTLPTFSGLPHSFADAGLVLANLPYIGIAGGSPYADNSINGSVYDFRIYGQSLNLSQVAAVYALGTNVNNSAIASALATPLPPPQVPLSGNLVRLPFYGSVGLHDPGTLRKNGNSYFIYGDGTGIPGLTSTNLRNWSSAPAVFPNGPPAWTTNSITNGTPNYFWAPDTAFFNGLWHMYYAYSDSGTIDSVIGVATSPSLTNAVWTDQGKVVKSYDPATSDTDTTAYNCIDPSIYVAANGTVWMSYGSYSSGILVTQINPTNGLRWSSSSLGTLVANNAPGHGWGSTEEGSCIYQHGGYWYLLVNWGGCCDLTYSTYNIRVGRGTSPTGPYFDRNGMNLTNSGGTMFLESTARYIGPGHAAIMDDNGTNWFTYHFYDGLADGYPTVGMNQLYWSADGWPVLTNEWSALYPLATEANESSSTYNGTLENNAGFTNDPVRGSVLYLDGVTNCVSLPLSIGNASTFAVWVNWRGGAAWQRIFDFGNDTTNYFFLTPNTGGGVMRFAISTNGPGGEQQINAPFSLPTNSWHHVAVVLDGVRGILFLDGAPIATNSALTIRPWQTTPHNNNLGKSQFAADPYLAGEMSGFRVFGRALSAAEINALYAANPMLAHRYSFNTNDPSAVWDSIGMAPGLLMGNAVVTNNALYLTGAIGGFANLPNSLVSGCAALTLEFWATLGVNGNWSRVFDIGGISGADGYNELYFTPHNGSSQQQMMVSTGSGSATLATGGALDGKTLHVAAIWDSTNNYMAIYTNGVLETQLTTSVPSPTGVASVFDANAWSFLGRSLWSADAYLNGSLDEVRLYAGRLSPQQIAADTVAGPNLIGLFDVWNGLGTNLNWSTSSNWIAAKAPNGSGDTVLFAGLKGLAPNLDANWTVAGLTFATNAGSFTLGSTNGSGLTLAGGATLANNSVAAQTVALPVNLSGAATFSTAPGKLILSNAVSGSGSLTKLGGGTLVLAANNSYAGITTVSGGVLALNGAGAIPDSVGIFVAGGALLDVSAAAGFTLGGAQSLSGSGAVLGAITNQGTIFPGTPATMGTLTFSNSPVMAGAGVTLMKISCNGGTLASDQLLLPSSAITYGGTLIVTNLGGPLQAGDAFPLFSAVSYGGSFAATQLPALTNGLAWSTASLSSGILVVLPSTPTNLTWSVTGTNLQLSWPANYVGWQLQVQTNALNLGLGTNWVNVPGASLTNCESFPIDPAVGNLFYRLVFP